jgi:predicted nucleotidyltransferase
MATSRTEELRSVAATIAAALPSVVEEVVLTGSVSRGVADELSDIELLLVTREQLSLADCFDHARAVGLTRLDTWGAQGTEVSRVFGYYGAVPVETIWWPHDFAEATVAAFLAGRLSPAAEAIANGLPLRSAGLAASWQQRLAHYPDAVAAAEIEDAALAWGGFHPSGFLTLARPHERLATVEYLYDDAVRVLRIVYALNRVWPRTSKRLAARVADLRVTPERLAERIEEALTEPDPRRAMLVMAELKVDTVDLAPPGPNVDRARRWLRDVVDVLRREGSF